MLTESAGDQGPHTPVPYGHYALKYQVGILFGAEQDFSSSFPEATGTGEDTSRGFILGEVRI